MQSIIYATFHDSRDADRAFVELLSCGVGPQDLLVVTLRSYADAEFHSDDGRLEISEPNAAVAQDSEEASGIEQTQFGDSQPLRNPFPDEPGGVGIEDCLRRQGDLMGRLIEIGFGEQIAASLEKTVTGGGALLILRPPSGAVDEIQAWETIERCGGAGLAQMRNGPYMG